jgi:hypothetical protein
VGGHYAQRSAASVGTRHRSHRLSMLAVSPSLIGVRPKLIMIKVHTSSCVHDVGGSAALWALGMGFNGQRHVRILPESYGIGSQWLPRCPSAALRPTLIHDSSARCIAVGMMSEARQHYGR